MQWLLQDFEDTRKLGVALERLGLRHSWHKVVPFVGDLIPEPVVDDPNAVVLFGSYALWKTAEAQGYKPGIFRLTPFVHEVPWQPYLLNGADARFVTLSAIPETLAGDDRPWFMRPEDDSKAIAGGVKSARQIVEIAQKVLALDVGDIPMGSLRHDTVLMLTRPAQIHKEWRLWVVEDRVVTYSLYKEGARVVYRPEIDQDALDFAEKLVALNPGYARAYVMDLCRTADGLRMLETNCLNAAGFYAADLVKLAAAIEEL